MTSNCLFAIGQASICIAIGMCLAMLLLMPGCSSHAPAPTDRYPVPILLDPVTEQPPVLNPSTNLLKYFLFISILFTSTFYFNLAMTLYLTLFSLYILMPSLLSSTASIMQ